MSKILFLDFDGVVNTPQWYTNYAGEYVCTYTNQGDCHVVNNYQACQWVSEFCMRNGYKIVITSSWRLHRGGCKAALYNGGLRPEVEVLGETAVLNQRRGDEIDLWLRTHPDVEEYIIFDDEDDFLYKQKSHLIKCTQNGFLANEFDKAQIMVKRGKTKYEG